MENQIKKSVKMVWTYFLLHMLGLTLASKFTVSYSSDIFNNMLCESSATKLTGVFSLLSCADGCAKANGCMSFFYESTKNECYSVNLLLTSTSGCQSRAGVMYFMMFSQGCYENVSGDYNGRWSRTESGRRCQRWDSQWPHEHVINYPAFYFPQDASLFDAHNYCRDPDYEGRPWCYTVDENVRWEFCNIPRC